MTCGIYKIKNLVNGKLYIGQSCDIEERWKQHIRASKTVVTHLYKSIRKHGIDNFTFSIICEVPESALDEYEISYIKYYETTDTEKGYNKTFGGEGGRKTNETKTKMSESHKGKPKSDATKKKLSNAKRGNQHNLKQYQYQGIVYNGLRKLANFLGLKYSTLSSRIIRKLIDVTILSQSQKN